jgi:hypothetical protein
MNKKFNPMKTRFRATFAGAMLGAQRLGQIDEENEVLHDVQITLEGEALGHGVWLDREFCEAVAAAGNATGDVGLKVRYGHPSMCSDAIGTELGRAKNFRVVDFERDVDGQKVKCAGVIADVYMLKSAHSAPQGDLVAHVMATAKEDPSQFGQSIVFTYADWVVKDADGNRHSFKEEVMDPITRSDGTVDWKKYNGRYDAWMEKSVDGKLYAVLGKLHGSDFTDTPAATDGIFSTGTLAEEAEQMLDEHPQILEVLEKSPKSVVEFLERTGLAEKVESARVAGMQAAKDKEIGELKAQAKAAADEFAAKENDLNGKIGQLTGELSASKDEVSALTKKLEDTQKALSAAQGDLATAREQLTAAQAAHRKLTAGTLQVGDAGTVQLKTMSEFVKDHGGSFSRAVKEDPETYKAICAKLGCAPVAIQ